MSKLGLEKLAPETFRGTGLSDEEWLEVKAARDRGITWKQIFRALPPGRTASINSLQSVYSHRFRRR